MAHDPSQPPSGGRPRSHTPRILAVGVALCLGGGACGEKSTQLERPSDTGTEGAGSSLPELEVEPVEATWSAQEVESAVQDALSMGFPAPATVRDAYLELISAGDAGCPGDDYQILDQFLQGCTSGEDYWYAGISEWVEEHQSPEPMVKVGVDFHLWALLGDFEIVDPEGREFHGGGHVAAWNLHAAGPQRSVWGGEFVGSWLWEGHDTWLSEEVSASLEYSGVEPRLGERTLTLDGGITWLGTSLNMDELTFADSCPAHPGGMLQVRDPVGSWHAMELTACEPCATVVFGDEEELGEACLDFTGVVDGLFEELERPWEYRDP